MRITRPASKIVMAALAAGVLVIVVAGVRAASEEIPCGAGFFRQGARCCPTSAKATADRCALGIAMVCPGPLVSTARGCDAPEHDLVEVPATRVLIGPSDWEAEGRVRARTVDTRAFAIDRFEVTEGHRGTSTSDAARAASSVTLFEARAFCAAHGGRLPTEDEWIVAAAGDRPRRYPWGDTGAVCRRAAWGLARGPCGSGATGPDTVGAHGDGATPLGIHDLAGNVAEWVETGACPSTDGSPDAGSAAVACTAVVRGGSFDTDLATDLRTWVRREVPASSKEPSIGFRCAYEPVVSRTPQ